MKKFLNIVIVVLAKFALISISYAQQWEYEVKKGDTLWDIADQYLISEEYTWRLQSHNNVKDPLVLQPGRIIKAPVEWLGNLPGSATLVSVSGKVKVLKDGDASSARVGSELQVNDGLITGEDGVAKLEFSDMSTVTVYSNTKMVFDQAKQSHDGSVIKARISMTSGRAYINVNPEKKSGHKLEIESPAAVTAVRGTSFRIGVMENSGDTVTEVLQGNVSVETEQTKVAVKKLYGTKTEPGQAPIRPVELLQAPQITVQDKIESKIGQIQWQSIENAQSYRIRVARDEKFTDVVYDHVATTNLADNIFFPKDGDYYTLVRAIDKNEIEGLDSMASFKVNARPEPPLIIGPKDNTATFNTEPVFSWAIPADSTTELHYQLARDAEFASLVHEQVIPPTDTFELDQALESGNYYWRVANLDKDGRGPFSDPSLLSIKKEPELNQEILESGSGSKVNLTLTRDPTISRYHVQVARDAGFENVIFEDWVDGEEFAFNTRGAGSYYIHLGVEDQETNTINYGEAQKITVPFTEWRKVLMSLITGLIIAL